MQGGYFRTAWRDVSGSPGWFGRLLTLALVGLVPVFGQIVILGYLYGWAREAAWNVHAPLPPHIFGGDSKLYSRGFSALVILLVCAIVPILINGALSILSKVAAVIVGVGSGAFGVLVAAIAGLSALVTLAVVLLALLLMVVRWVGTMRMSIYGRLSAGFQLRKIGAMVRHGSGGLARIVGMNVVMTAVASVLMLAVVGVALLVLVLALFITSGFDLSFIGDFSEGDFTGVPPSLALMVLIVLVLVGLSFMTMWTFIEMMTARAMGYWTAQFDVINWGGQDDPMPFELAGAYGAPPGGVYGPGGPRP